MSRSRSRKRRRRSEQLEAASVAIYVVALLLAGVIVVLRTVPESAVPALQAIVLFLGILASLLLAVSRLIERGNDDRL
jgi:heme A synthase